MTRLITEWIADMEKTSAEWNNRLVEKTGICYCEIADRASAKMAGEIADMAGYYKVAVVPITSGLGTIDTFSESVAAIVRAMGFETFVTSGCDVNGIFEAACKDADIVFMADDDRYIALNLSEGRVGDNNIGTAFAYVEVLNALSEKNRNCSLAAKKVAVLGYGIIGQLTAQALRERDAEVFVYDKNPVKEELVQRDKNNWIENIEELKGFEYIVDGTSEGGWLSMDMLNQDVLIAAPGIPLSLDSEAEQLLEGRYIHDLLEIGTAGMIGFAL